jgi:membrane protein implicated in regulation of membrane protease activity
MTEKQENNLAVTAIIVIIMYAGLTMALFYGVKGEWDAVLFNALASIIAFFCKRKREDRDRKRQK